MAKKDKNYVSFWFWFFAMFVTAIPCIGIVMVLVWAFMGENESRKNYFRALIVWMLLFFAIWTTAIMLLGLSPAIIPKIEEWLRGTRRA